MPRYKLTLEYDGTPFVGWQRQDNGMSVQQALEEAIFKFSGETVNTAAAGRTDAGVHARGQVAHADIGRAFPADEVMGAINFHMRPHPIVVVGSEEVPDDFHARFSAKKRSYVYRIINRRAPLVLDEYRAWHVPQPLNEKAMHAAAQHLVGKHDFTSLRASECQSKSPIKTLDEVRVTRQGDVVEIYVKAQSFLHHMVRNITGTLYNVGLGKWSPKDVERILEAKDRTRAGQTAPADGLYFLQVEY
jgi:tRNA pseudouridine38-40 synthase